MPKGTITFDLETIADKTVIPFLPPVEPDSRLKDSVKIQASIEKKEGERFSKLGLDPTTARICCFGWHDGEKTNHIMLRDETNSAEFDLLHQVWEVLSKANHFITFNGNGFDIPMLKMRSLINRVRPSVNIATKKWRIDNHTDVRAVLNNWDNYAKGTLDFYSKLLLGKSSKEQFDGSMVQDMWDMKLYKDIGKYCESDVLGTYEIYQLLLKYYL